MRDHTTSGPPATLDNSTVAGILVEPSISPQFLLSWEQCRHCHVGELVQAGHHATERPLIHLPLREHHRGTDVVVADLDVNLAGAGGRRCRGVVAVPVNCNCTATISVLPARLGDTWVN